MPKNLLLLMAPFFLQVQCAHKTAVKSDAELSRYYYNANLNTCLNSREEKGLNKISVDHLLQMSLLKKFYLGKGTLENLDWQKLEVPEDIPSDENGWSDEKLSKDEPEDREKLIKKMETSLDWNAGECADISTKPLIKAMLSGLNLKGAKLSFSDLSEADLSDVNLTGAQLEQTKLLGANLDRVLGDNTQLLGVYAYRLSSKNSSWKNSDWSGSRLMHADFAGANFYKAVFFHADLSEVNFEKANLSKAYLVSSNLGRSNLDSALLINADLSKARLYGAVLNSSKLFGAKLRGTWVRKIQLRQADFEETALVE